MAFFKKRITIRTNEEIQKKTKWIQLEYPDVFENDSHVHRCAINILFNKLKRGGLNELKQ